MIVDPADGPLRAAQKTASSMSLGAPMLIRSGMNHVYRAGSAVIRISPPYLSAHAQVDLASLLEKAGIPTARPLSDAFQLGDWGVSVWEYVGAAPSRSIDYRQVGAIVGLLHSLRPEVVAQTMPQRWCGEAAWLDVGAGLGVVREERLATPDGLAALDQAWDKLKDWQDHAWQAELVVGHGDVHPENVVMSDHGVVLLDWDGIGIGPRAWDHAPLLTWPERWGGGATDYAEFAAGYGQDFSSDPLGRELSRPRRLAPTVNLLVRTQHEPRLLPEAEARMRYWLGHPDPPAWAAQ